MFACDLDLVAVICEGTFSARARARAGAVSATVMTGYEVKVKDVVVFSEKGEFYLVAGNIEEGRIWL